MTTQLSDILSDIKECNSMLDNNTIDEAVILSGDALARAHHYWSTAFNNHRNTLHEVNVMAIAAASHCEALASAGSWHDAYATALGSILQISVDCNQSDSINQALLSIYTTAAISLLRVLSDIAPNDEESRDHASTITRYIASMLYHLYNLVGNKAPNSPYLEAAYATLCHMRQFAEIQSPEIDVLGRQISPQEPHDLIGDLIGRSRALSLLSDV